MHPPIRVDPEHIEEFLTAFQIRCLELLHHVLDSNVRHQWYRSSNKRYVPHSLVAIEIAAMKIQFCIMKGIQAQHFDRILTRRCQMPTSQDAKESLKGCREKAVKTGRSEERTDLPE